ncbi:MULTISPECIES: hypothetical protein [unclassified Rhizobium]
MTETSYDRQERARDALRQIKQRSVPIAMADFGTGNQGEVAQRTADRECRNIPVNVIRLSVIGSHPIVLP